MSAGAEIEVRAAEDGPGHVFEVVVRERGGETRHRVTVSQDDRKRFGGDEVPPADLVKESFRFLLEREPKESILGRFALNVIARYFPEYPREIARRLKRG